MIKNLVQDVIELEVPHWILRERSNINTLPELSSVYYHLIIPKEKEGVLNNSRFEESYENAGTVDTILTKTEQQYFFDNKERYTKKKEDDIYEIRPGELEKLIKS